MTFAAEYLVGFVTAWTLPFFRIAAAVTTSPVLGNRAVPVRVKLGVAVVLTLAIGPLLPELPEVDPTSTSTVLLVMREVLIGLAFGFTLRLALLVMELAGQLIAHLMGLGFAALVDPQTGIDVPTLSQFYIILATFVFLGLDGHLILVTTLAESFRVLPVGLPALDLTSLWEMTQQAGWAFGAALKLALPAIVTLLVVNFAFGVISRAAPQLHIIVIGFPLTLVFGFIIIWLTYTTVVGELGGVYGRAFGYTEGLIAGFR
ncbi:MAG: flagellar biosynthetic protein FliR [Gammaproteobacteria bacterium]|nr:flagellar biosynthetic protein FliR [Gammaproteobacteria bacterium]